MTQLNDIEKRRMILGEARKLFLRFGFSKTSMEDIAHQCNIAKPTLYYYYTKKEAIFDAIVSEEAENFLKKLNQKLDEDLPADRKLLLFMNIVYEHLNLYAKELAKMPEMLCESSPHGRPVVKKIRENFRFLLGRMLQEGEEKGIFRIGDHESHLNAVALMISFMNLDWMQKNAEPTRRQTLESVTEILLNGLRKDPE